MLYIITVLFTIQTLKAFNDTVLISTLTGQDQERSYTFSLTEILDYLQRYLNTSVNTPYIIVWHIFDFKLYLRHYQVRFLPCSWFVINRIM